MPILPGRLYVPGDSFFHKLAPHAKITWLILVFLYSILTYDAVILTALFISTLLIAAASRVSLRRFSVVFKLYLALIIISFFIFAGLLGSGEVLFRIWIFGFTASGLLLWILTVFRFILFPTATLVFFMTTDQPDIVQSLSSLKIPYKMVFVISALFRYLPLVAGAWDSVIEAQVSRGLNLKKGSIITRFRKTLKLFPPIIFTLLHTVRTNALALESKAFGAYPKRTYYRVYQMKRADYVVIGFLISLIVIGFILRIVYGPAIFLEELLAF